MRKKVLIRIIIMKANGRASLGGESGFLGTSISSILSSSSVVNCCFLFYDYLFLEPHWNMMC